MLGDGDYSDLGLMDQYPDQVLLSNIFIKTRYFHLDQDLDTMDAIYSPQQQQPSHQAAQPQAQKPKEQAQGKKCGEGPLLLLFFQLTFAKIVTKTF